MTKAEYLIELAESISQEVRQQVQQQVHMERAKFRHASTGPSLSHALKVIRELHRVKGYRPDQNMTQLPTVGMDAEYDKYDPNPESRWDPEFRKQLEASRNKDKEQTRAGQLLKKKDGTLIDPQTGAPIDPETGEVITQENPGQEDDEQPPQDPSTDPNQVQQDPAQAQQAGDPQAQQDLDPNAGQQELPGDQRKDPTWKGHIPSPKPVDQPDSSQRVVSRYSTELDPMRKKVKPTSAYLRRKMMREPQSHSKTGRHGPVQKYWG